MSVSTQIMLHQVQLVHRRQEPGDRSQETGARGGEERRAAIFANLE